MKFIHYLEKISGVSIYGLSSLLIFALFFLVMSIWALRADKNMMEELRQLPLDKLKGKAPLLLIVLLLSGMNVHAADPDTPSVTGNPFVVLAIIIMIILAIAIALLANVLRGVAQIPVKPEPGADDKTTTDKEELTYAGGLARTGSPGAAVTTTVVVLAWLFAAFSPTPAHAEDQTTAAATLSSTRAVNGISDTAFYMICGVILLEVLVLLTLLYNVKLVLSIHKKDKAAAAQTAGQATSQPAVPRISWWEKINRFRSSEEEVTLDLGHDYDGIRELDNRLPPWWLYGFYCSILFACVYLWRYHVSHSAPLSAEEYTISVQKAEQQKIAYLKKTASLVDENTVKVLTAEGDLAAGRKVFETTCFACHGKAGEGGVGPNLTDEYWLHGGSIQDVFKSIKYGWADKGMKSWKDDFSPSQIAQIASYVLSLQGTHPANAKAPQGTVSK
ncbi:MAG TPA: cbb3-type cytochrome c oxidase N-terminal domain-containing protein [Puia sp.]|nr:cbb3-type cytochrome c oxidase N-terminal domain-containing protein [Puia sp.]